MHHDGMFLLHLFIKIFKFNNNLFLTLWRLLCLPVYSWSSLQHWWQVDTWLSRAGRVSHLITVQLHSWLDYYIYIKWAMTLWLTDWLAEFTTVQQYVCSIFCCCYSHSTLMCWSFLKWRHQNVPNFMILDMMFNA